MQTQVFSIEGMSCEMCVKHVTQALEGLDGVEAASVSLADNSAVVTYDPAKVQPAQMAAAVDEEGYAATPREDVS